MVLSTFLGDVQLIADTLDDLGLTAFRRLLRVNDLNLVVTIDVEVLE